MSINTTSRRTVPKEVVVIGAGPTGMVTALLLASQGHKVTVLERKREYGAGPGSIQIPVNGSSLLVKWGLEEVFRTVASKKRLMHMQRYDSLETLYTTVTEPGSARWVVHRDDLLAILRTQIDQAGVQVLFDKKVVSLDAERVTVSCLDGTRVNADLIIGADGITSTVRRLMYPKRDTAPLSMPTVCFQAFIPRDRMFEDPELREMYEEGEVRAIMGPEKYVMAWSQPSLNAYYVGVMDAKGRESVSRQAYNESRSHKYVNDSLTNFGSKVQKLIRAVEHWSPWRIAVARPGIDWVSASGKVILLGDAAHSMTPDAAQGLSQGLEDAEAISCLLARCDDVFEATKAYETIRKPRATRMQDFATANAQIFALEDGEAQRARDNRLRALGQTSSPDGSFEHVEADENASFVDPAFRKWIAHYSVEDEVEKLLRQTEWMQVLISCRDGAARDGRYVPIPLDTI